MLAHNESDDIVGRRRAKRTLFRADVQFGHSGRRNRISVLDLSTQGARLRLIHKLQIGDTFWIKLPGLNVMSAKVAWSRDFIIGCEFNEPLHPAMFEALINRRIKPARTEKKRLLAV